MYAEAYDDKENGSDVVKEKTKELATLADDMEKIYITFVMEEGKDSPLFKMYYALEEDAEENVKTDFMPSDHTWVGAKIGLFANVLAEKEKGGYADFEYIHVAPLTTGN